VSGLLEIVTNNLRDLKVPRPAAVGASVGVRGVVGELSGYDPSIGSRHVSNITEVGE